MWIFTGMNYGRLLMNNAIKWAALNIASRILDRERYNLEMAVYYSSLAHINFNDMCFGC